MKIKKSLLVTLIFCCICIVLLILFSRIKQRKQEGCNLKDGCLNEVLLEDMKDCNYNKPCKAQLQSLTKKEFDQIIYLRKQQYDLSKPCGKMSLNYKEKLLFDDDCSYMIFSNNSKMVNYIKGECVDDILSYRDPSHIVFYNKDEVRMINRVLDKNLIIHKYKNIAIQIDSNTKTEKLACFTEFSRQGL